MTDELHDLPARHWSEPWQLLILATGTGIGAGAGWWTNDLVDLLTTDGFGLGGVLVAGWVFLSALSQVLKGVPKQQLEWLTDFLQVFVPVVLLFAAVASSARRLLRVEAPDGGDAIAMGLSIGAAAAAGLAIAIRTRKPKAEPPA